jgi:hypothetical protein
LLTRFGHVADEDICSLFDAADVVVLPYEDVLNSGSAILALSLDKPVIAPLVGSFPDLQSMVGNDWVHLYQTPIDRPKLEATILWLRLRRTHLALEKSPDLSVL